MKNILIAIISLATLAVCAQVPSPAPKQSQTIALKGGTIHVGDGSTVIENGTIVFVDGKITAVGSNITVPTGAQVIDVAGKHIYPGLIAPATILGLNEVDALRQTRDFREVGSYNPNVRSIIAYNTDSRVVPTVRSNGILLAEIAPVGGRVSGSSSVVQLDAWNWEDAAYKTDMGVHINWPNLFRQTGWWAEPGPIELNKKYESDVNELMDFLKEAKAYAELDMPATTNLKLDALKGLFDGSKRLFVHVAGAREIMAVIDLKIELGLDVVIVGGSESWRVADVLKEHNVPVVLSRVHSLPDYSGDDIDQPYKLPAMLRDAGVEFCLSINGSWEQRNLPFMAGTAVTYGLTKEEALQAITQSPASILGIEENVGTLVAGKDATIIVSTGDVLDMMSSNIELAFISGRQIDLDDKQKMLYRKFQEKYQE